MAERNRNRPVWCTDEEFDYILREIEEEFGPRESNGLATGRAVVQLIGQRPSFVRSGGAR